MNLIVYFISNIFMSYALLKSYSFLSEKDLKINKNKLIFLAIICMLVSLNNYYTPISFRILVATILTFIMMKYIYKDGILQTIFWVIIITISSILIDLILSVILLMPFSHINIINESFFTKIFFSLIESYITIIFFNNKCIKKFIDKIENIINVFVNFYTFSLLLIFILNLATFIRGQNIQNFSLLILIFLSLVFLFYCIKIIVNDKYNNKILLERNKNLKDSYKAYSETIDECRELKHNLKNDLYSLKTLLPQEQQNKINDIILKYNSKYEWINRIDNIPEGIQGIIFLKTIEAKESNVKIYINTTRIIETNENDYIDLCGILGILIDNAIEASKETKKKIIEINITENNSTINIKIINLFTNSIDINKIGKKNYSTKEYKSGIGLNYIKNINNSRVKVNFKIINDLFITNIEYKKNSIKK